MSEAEKTTVATHSTQSGGFGSWGAGVPVPLTLSATAAALELAVGEVLVIEIAKAGTGVVVPAGQLVVEYKHIGS